MLLNHSSRAEREEGGGGGGAHPPTHQPTFSFSARSAPSRSTISSISCSHPFSTYLFQTERRRGSRKVGRCRSSKAQETDREKELTHPPTHPPIHKKRALGSSKVFFKKAVVQYTHPPTHPPTHSTRPPPPWVARLEVEVVEEEEEEEMASPCSSLVVARADRDERVVVEEEEEEEEDNRG